MSSLFIHSVKYSNTKKSKQRMLIFKHFCHFLFHPQLTVGLYEFEVIVNGDGAHGEGYVNVTVKPGDCFVLFV